MKIRWIALLSLAALLYGCATPPSPTAETRRVWNGGIWNSVLGYHGPANATVMP